MVVYFDRIGGTEVYHLQGFGAILGAARKVNKSEGFRQFIKLALFLRAVPETA
jgi:hypothetical protein